MQIALTKSLSDEMKLKPGPADATIDPIFTWTATWDKVWVDSRSKEMLVLVNNATRFPVAIYPVKRKDLKKASQIIRTAIEQTLRSLYINPELIDEYFRLAGEVELVKNSSLQTGNWVKQARRYAAFAVDRRARTEDYTFDNTIGVPISDIHVPNRENAETMYKPRDKMLNAIAELTGKPIYQTRAFELLITLDLDVYQASRRIIVPANLTFVELHLVIQKLYKWYNYHLFDFEFYEENPYEPFLRLTSVDESLDYDEIAILIDNHTLDEYLPKYQHFTYIYDMGDHWEHSIELVRTIENCPLELPYLLEAEGQGPPEDVGGVGGFVEFREIMLDANHPEHEDMKLWAEYWQLTLSDSDKTPGPRRIVW